MDLTTISERILDSNFSMEIIHSEEDVVNSPPSDVDAELTHYGILGMKWGVRRTQEQLGHRKKRDRRYEDETDQQYQARMERESRERTAKTTAKSQERQQKARIKAEADIQKRQLKSQERQQKLQIKAQERQRRDQREEQARQRKDQASKKSKTKTITDPIKTMTDQELNDAINRLRREAEYKQLTRKPDGILKKTVKGAGKVGGGVLLAVGKNIVTRQLSDIGNQKADAYLKKHGLKKDGSNADSKKGKSSETTNDEILTRIMLLEEKNN